jgi:hypothetical protein
MKTITRMFVVDATTGKRLGTPSVALTEKAYGVSSEGLCRASRQGKLWEFDENPFTSTWVRVIELDVVIR